MKRVVWATDFSDNSRYVGGFLKAVSRKEETEVLLLHVFPDIVGMYGPFIPQTPNVVSTWESARERAEVALKNWLREWEMEGLNVQAKLVVGTPKEEIVREALRFKADWIAVGTRGLSGIKGFLVGSLAKALLHDSPIPVLTVRFPHVKMERILVPVDLSSATEKVIKYLPKLRSLGEITLYHAVVIDFYMEREEKEEWKEKILKEMPRIDGVKTVVDIAYHRHLDVSEVIVKYAERNRYDLILITSHGRTGIEKVIFGSVAEGVITKSHVPVLTLNLRTLSPAILE